MYHTRPVLPVLQKSYFAGVLNEPERSGNERIAGKISSQLWDYAKSCTSRYKNREKLI